MFKCLIGFLVLVLSVSIQANPLNNGTDIDHFRTNGAMDEQCLRESSYAYRVMVARQDNKLSMNDMLRTIELIDEDMDVLENHRNLIKEAYKRPKHELFSGMVNEVDLFKAEAYDECMLKRHHLASIVKNSV